ncbi:MAG: FAD-binding oxidoreductase [Candidatus Korobacteraceae bacterium]
MTQGTATSGAWSEVRSALLNIVGEKGCLFNPDDTAPYCEDWRKLERGSTPAVVRPASTEEVAAIVRLCAERRIPIVPQGGNTNMVIGAIPSPDGTEIVLTLSRMNRIRNLDAVDLTLTIDAGATLKAAQEAALSEGCIVPLTMGSEGSAQIGGVLSTNAGGNNTLRYGNARDMVLGLEVVLPDGAIWNGLRRLRKDNTGYCLRQLFVGAEGTLGIITAAVLKLVPRPRDLALAFCAVASTQAALDLLVLCRRHFHDSINAFEYMEGRVLAIIRKHFPEIRYPLSEPAAHCAWVELADASPDAGLRQKLEDVLAEAMEKGIVLDAALAGSSSERQAIWQLREEVTDAQQREGASIKNDVTVPVSKTPEFITRATAECERQFPGIRVMAYGHLGDGNTHFNLTVPIGGDNAAFKQQTHEVQAVVNEVVRQYDGSFSAEHGIGRLKPYMMEKWRGGAELDTMRKIKAALDPLGIMNPGKLLP